MYNTSIDEYGCNEICIDCVLPMCCHKFWEPILMSAALAEVAVTIYLALFFGWAH